MTVLTKPQKRLRRRRRVRARIRGSAERPRLSVYRSNRGVFAQLIDDDAGRTLASVCWTEAELRKLGPMEQAKRAGRAARRARQGGRRRDLRLRPRRLPLPRPGRADRRGRPRGGPEVLMAAQRSSATFIRSMAVETVSPKGLDLQERVIEINRVAKVVKGGRRFSFTALVAVGDEDSVVGIGYGKAREVPLAIQKAVEDARKNLIRVPKYGQTITHRVIGRFGAGHVVLRPASPGTGVIAGGGVRAVLELGGVRDVLTKSIGTQNPINLVKATMSGLESLRRPEDVAKLRGISIREVLGVGDGNGGQASRGADEAEAPTPASSPPTARPRLRRGPVAAEPPPRPPRRPRRRSRRALRPRRLLMADVDAQAGPLRERRLRRQRDTLRSLKLGRIGREAKHADTPQLQGMIRMVSHLVEVDGEKLMAEEKKVGLHTLEARARLAPAAQAARARCGNRARQDLGSRPQGRRRPLRQQAQDRLRGRPEPDPHADAQAARAEQEDVDAVREVPDPDAAGQPLRPRRIASRRTTR